MSAGNPDQKFMFLLFLFFFFLTLSEKPTRATSFHNSPSTRITCPCSSINKNTTNAKDPHTLRHQLVCCLEKLPWARVTVTSRLLGVKRSVSFSQPSREDFLGIQSWHGHRKTWQIIGKRWAEACFPRLPVKIFWSRRWCRFWGFERNCRPFCCQT